MELQTTAIVVLVYGALVALGGVIGYAKAQSKPSLYAGIGFGLALLMSGYLMWQGDRRAVPGALVLSVLLLLVMGSRYILTRKFMPAGLVTLLSLVAIVLLAMAWRR